MGRPLLEIDGNLVEKLAGIGARNNEIADFVGCSTDTLENRFSAQLTKGRANLKMSVRRWQLKYAEQGNSALLIWLGKQMLGQTDTVTVSGDSEMKITMNYSRDKKKKPIE